MHSSLGHRYQNVLSEWRSGPNHSSLSLFLFYFFFTHVICFSFFLFYIIVWMAQTTWNRFFSILIWATSICGPKWNTGLMFCNVTSVWTVISEFMQFLIHSRSGFSTLALEIRFPAEYEAYLNKLIKVRITRKQVSLISRI